MPEAVVQFPVGKEGKRKKGEGGKGRGREKGGSEGKGKKRKKGKRERRGRGREKKKSLKRNTGYLSGIPKPKKVMVYLTEKIYVLDKLCSDTSYSAAGCEFNGKRLTT
jgi:hypothetical protein